MDIKHALIALVCTTCLSASARAHDLPCKASLNGPSENPPNESPATASALVTIDFDLFRMRVEIEFSGLEGTVTSAHVHAVTPEQLGGSAIAATPSFAGFPTTTSGVYDETFDLTEAAAYNPDFVAAHGGTISTASNALFDALITGKAYIDIHTAAFSDGEIRGFLFGPKIFVTHFATSPNGAQRAVAIQGTVEPSGAGVLLEKSSDLQHWSFVTNGESDLQTGVYVLNVNEDASTLQQYYRVTDLLEPPGEPRPPE